MAYRTTLARQQQELKHYNRKQRDCECRRQVQLEGLERELAFQESRRQRILEYQKSLRQVERELCKMELENQKGLHYRKGRLSQLDQEMQQMKLEHQERMRQIAGEVIAPPSPEKVSSFEMECKVVLWTSNFFDLYVKDGECHLRDKVQKPVVKEATAPPAAPSQTCYVAEKASIFPDLHTVPEAPIESTPEPVVKEATAPPAAPPQTGCVAEKVSLSPGLIIPGRSCRALVASLDQGMSRWYSRAPI